MQCPRCAYDLRYNARFCDRCGKTLHNDEAFLHPSWKTLTRAQKVGLLGAVLLFFSAFVPVAILNGVVGLSLSRSSNGVWLLPLVGALAAGWCSYFMRFVVVTFVGIATGMFFLYLLLGMPEGIWYDSVEITPSWGLLWGFVTAACLCSAAIIHNRSAPARTA